MIILFLEFFRISSLHRRGVLGGSPSIIPMDSSLPILVIRSWLIFTISVKHHRYLFVTLLPCAVESHPTPGDSRGSPSPSRSIAGVSSHVA